MVFAHRHDKEISGRAREIRGRKQQNRRRVTMWENSYEFLRQSLHQALLYQLYTSCCIIARRKFWEGPCNLDYTVALEKTFPLVVADNIQGNFATAIQLRHDNRSLPSLHFGAALAVRRVSGYTSARMKQ